MVEVRPIRVEEWRELRAVRLRALADAPDAFGTTLAEAESQSDQEWMTRAERGARGETARTFIAIEEGGLYGLVGVVLSEGDADVAELVSMWVDPSRRRRGVGLALMRAAELWAEERGCRTMQLWVTNTNAAARALYQRTSFADTGRKQQHPSNRVLEELLLKKELKVQASTAG